MANPGDPGCNCGNFYCGTRWHDSVPAFLLIFPKSMQIFLLLFPSHLYICKSKFSNSTATASHLSRFFLFFSHFFSYFFLFRSSHEPHRPIAAACCACRLGHALVQQSQALVLLPPGEPALPPPGLSSLSPFWLSLSSWTAPPAAASLPSSLPCSHAHTPCTLSLVLHGSSCFA